MRRWVGSIGVVGRRSVPSRRLLIHRRCIATTSQPHHRGPRHRHSTDRPNLFDRVSKPNKRPDRNPEPWFALLDCALPAHLRVSQDDTPSTTINAQELVDLLFAARDAQTTSRHGAKVTASFDLLYELGITQGRWRAVVYLVKQLMENFPKPLSTKSNLTVWPWANNQSLRELTWSGPVHIEPPARLPPEALHTQSLDALTSEMPESYDDDEKATRRVLGFIWRSIGHMVIASGDEIKPEVLEILAYLHHHGWIHMSIYNTAPHGDPIAIQQPPTLSLLSSRILTSLSDAAWRAHEKLVVEEALVKGGGDASRRPEVPGSAYRINVAGLRPEVWLELILWSCLHGGWILDGASVMHTLAQVTEGGQWKPLSWRMIAFPGADYSGEWEAIGQAFESGSAAHNSQSEDLDVRKTISSELVDAYIDALISHADRGLGRRDRQANAALVRLVSLHDFLSRGHLTTTGNGSWDRVVSRIFDTQGDKVLHSVEALSHMASLSASFGDELQTKTSATTPAYLHDRSSTMLGIFHLALRDSIAQGDIDKTLFILKLLQDYTDRNKRDSIRAFFESRHGNQQEWRLFDQNYPTIEYPAFDMQIPATILGPLVDLLTDSGQYQLCSWLLSQDRVDGPIVPQELFIDPSLLPALLRFAVEAGEQELLKTLLIAKSQEEQDSLPSVTVSFLDAQIRLKRWSAVIKVLKHIQTSKGLYWRTSSLAILINAMLSAQTRQQAGEAGAAKDLDLSKKIFAAMVCGEFRNGSPYRRNDGLDVFLIVLSSVSPYWAKFILPLKEIQGHRQMSLPIRSFNLMLEAILDGHGSIKGRELVGIFWSHEVRQAQEYTSPFLRTRLDDEDRQRKVIHPAGRSDKTFVIYGGIRPNVRTIRLILSRVLSEIQDRRPSDAPDITTELAEAAKKHENHIAANPDHMDSSAYGMLRWAIRRLQEMGKNGEAIVEYLSEGLSPTEISCLEHLWVDADEEEGPVADMTKRQDVLDSKR